MITVKWSTSSVIATLKNLIWETVEKRRTLFQLKYVHKMFPNRVGLKPFDYFESNTNSTLQNNHSNKLALKFASVDIVKNSFFYSVVLIWKSLPANIIVQTNSDVFFDLCKTQISEK